MSERLILFDIDGTLLTGGRIWRDAFMGALDDEFPGREFPRITFNGKTDPQILRELVEAAGLSTEGFEHASSEGARRVLARYLERAREALRAGAASEIRVLPGVQALLERLGRHSRARVGLLTGNIREGARMKLEAASLLDHFVSVLTSAGAHSAYGDDHWNRYELPRVAVERTERETGRRFSGKQIVIIGDTIHDVKCGASLGVSAIAVGTGHGVAREELLASGPDHYFDDLSDTAAVIEAIFS